MLYYPCVADRYGRILKKVSNTPMTKEKAEDFLKMNCWREWLLCEAIPQQVNTPNLHN